MLREVGLEPGGAWSALELQYLRLSHKLVVTRVYKGAGSLWSRGQNSWKTTQPSKNSGLKTFKPLDSSWPSSAPRPPRTLGRRAPTPGSRTCAPERGLARRIQRLLEAARAVCGCLKPSETRMIRACKCRQALDVDTPSISVRCYLYGEQYIMQSFTCSLRKQYEVRWTCHDRLPP